jgi:hypothetical protein
MASQGCLVNHGSGDGETVECEYVVWRLHHGDDITSNIMWTSLVTFFPFSINNIRVLFFVINMSLCTPIKWKEINVAWFRLC